MIASGWPYLTQTKLDNISKNYISRVTKEEVYEGALAGARNTMMNLPVF